MIGARLGAAAARQGLPVVDVPTEDWWHGVTAAVRSAVIAALAGRPRLRPGPELVARRLHENDVVYHQISAYERQIGAALPPFPYACICGRSGCGDVEPASTANY